MGAFSGRPPEQREASLRRAAEAAKLKRSGLTWEKVAEQTGYNDRSSAFRAVKQLLQQSRDLAYGEAELYREERMGQLNDLLAAVWPKAMKGDDKAVTQARLLVKQMAEMEGSIAPVRIEIGESDVDKALRELDAELQRRAAQAPGQAAGAQAQDG